MIDHIKFAEMNPKLAACMNRCTHQAYIIHPTNQGETGLMGHNDIIKQGTTDSKVAVI